MKLTTPEVLSLEYLMTYLDNLFLTMLTLSLPVMFSLTYKTHNDKTTKEFKY